MTGTDGIGERLADVYAGSCAMCRHWTGARITGVVDENAICMCPEMAARFEEREGEPGWYGTSRSHSCEYFEEVESPISVEDGGLKLDLPLFNFMSECRAIGLDPLDPGCSLPEAIEALCEVVFRNLEDMEDE